MSNKKKRFQWTTRNHFISKCRYLRNPIFIAIYNFTWVVPRSPPKDIALTYKLIKMWKGVFSQCLFWNSGWCYLFVDVMQWCIVFLINIFVNGSAHIEQCIVLVTSNSMCFFWRFHVMFEYRHWKKKKKMNSVF